MSSCQQLVIFHHFGIGIFMTNLLSGQTKTIWKIFFPAYGRMGGRRKDQVSGCNDIQTTHRNLLRCMT